MSFALTEVPNFGALLRSPVGHRMILLLLPGTHGAMRRRRAALQSDSADARRPEPDRLMSDVPGIVLAGHRATIERAIASCTIHVSRKFHHGPELLG